MKKYQQSNDTYKQLHELLEKNETKSRSRNSEQEMSKIEKELLKIYEKMSGDENHIMQNLICTPMKITNQMIKMTNLVNV